MPKSHWAFTMAIGHHPPLPSKSVIVVLKLKDVAKSYILNIKWRVFMGGELIGVTQKSIKKMHLGDVKLMAQIAPILVFFAQRAPVVVLFYRLALMKACYSMSFCRSSKMHDT